MSTDTIISNRIIKDYMLAINLKPFTITIDSSVMQAFRSARMKYEENLKSEKEKKSVGEKETQALQISSDIENLCSKCSTLERTIKMLDTDFIRCIKSAEEKDDTSLVEKGNALMRKSEETKSELDILLNEVKKLKEEFFKVTLIFSFLNISFILISAMQFLQVLFVMIRAKIFTSKCFIEFKQFSIKRYLCFLLVRHNFTGPF